MPAFHFEAIDIKNKIHKGILNADSIRNARMQLRAQNLIPISLEITSNKLQSDKKNRIALNKKLSKREQSILTRQLSSLITAGLTLDESILVLIEQSDRDYIRELMASIRSEILSGHSFANALKEHPDDFPSIYCAIISAGEYTGKLGIVLSKLADYIEKNNEIKQKTILAFIYPGVITVIAFGIVIFLLSYVVPQIVSIFINTNQKLPFLTIIMISISNIIRKYWWAILLAIISLSYFFKFMISKNNFRKYFDKKILNIPIIGKLIRGYNTARFASTLSILSSAGVPILRALQAANETISNRAMQISIEYVISRVREGVSLSRALGDTKEFPLLLIHLIRSGESTGNISTMLEQAAGEETKELERRSSYLTSLLEPILILIMGGIVLIIVLSVMLPIIELNNLIQ